MFLPRCVPRRGAALTRTQDGGGGRPEVPGKFQVCGVEPPVLSAASPCHSHHTDLPPWCRPLNAVGPPVDNRWAYGCGSAAAAVVLVARVLPLVVVVDAVVAARRAVDLEVVAGAVVADLVLRGRGRARAAVLQLARPGRRVPLVVGRTERLLADYAVLRQTPGLLQLLGGVLGVRAELAVDVRVVVLGAVALLDALGVQDDLPQAGRVGGAVCTCRGVPERASPFTPTAISAE